MKIQTIVIAPTVLAGFLGVMAGSFCHITSVKAQGKDITMVEIQRVAPKDAHTNQPVVGEPIGFSCVQSSDGPVCFIATKTGRFSD